MENNPILCNDPLGDTSGLGQLWDKVKTCYNHGNYDFPGKSAAVWINQNLNPLNDAVTLAIGKDYSAPGAPEVPRS